MYDYAFFSVVETLLNILKDLLNMTSVMINGKTMKIKKCKT